MNISPPPQLSNLLRPCIHTFVLFQHASLTQQMLIYRRGVIPIVTTDNLTYLQTQTHDRERKAINDCMYIHVKFML